jgi:hypothetical protein
MLENNCQNELYIAKGRKIDRKLLVKIIEKKESLGSHTQGMEGY